jgi:pantoate--beta-alanine ligase
MTVPLKVVRTIADLRSLIRGWRAQGDTVALVPTMGALHEGHLSLVRAGRSACRRVVATIFVNPLQFGAQEDLTAYPRDEARDLTLLQEAQADAAFLPAVDEMYPPGRSTNVTVAGVSEGLCGDFRPGHFAGVATVVAKLLLQALPDVALFGEKDYQQLHVIKRMARDLDIPVRIQGEPTVREPDGVALSSRNRYLTPRERAAAPALHRILMRVARQAAKGEDPSRLCAEGRTELEQLGFAPVQYLEVRDAETLAPVRRIDRPARVLVAAYLGRTRLIDNVAVQS